MEKSKERRLKIRVIARHICPHFPCLIPIGRGVVCKPSPIHFIEGLLIENTSARGAFRVLSLMSPLWVGNRQPVLDYSERLSRKTARGYTGYFEGTEQEIAEEAAALLKANSVYAERLAMPETPLETFLSRNVPEGLRTSARPTMQEDRGMALALLGQTEDALAILNKLVAGFAPNWSSPHGANIRAIRDSLAAGDGRHVTLITQMEVAAAKQIGLVRPEAEGA